MARKPRKTNVKAHKRQTRTGVIRVKAHCRRPPTSTWRRTLDKTREWGF